MKFPKPATDNRFKKLIKSYLWNRTVLNVCGIVADMWVDNDVPTLKNFYRSPFSKWPPQYRTNSTLSDFNAISYRTMLNSYCPFFMPWFWQPFWKWQTSRKFWKCRIAPIMVTYHYVKFYVSIIIPQYLKNSTLSDIIKIWYVDR
jgi:hypothetical protein